MYTRLEDTCARSSLLGSVQSNDPEALLDEKIQSRNIEICRSLNSLAKRLPEMIHLNNFRLKLLMNSPASIVEECRWSQTIKNLISSLPQSVTNLTIDNPGDAPRVDLDSHSESNGVGSGSDEGHSICHLLSSGIFLHSLRHLRLRARSICPKVLEMNSSEGHPLLETIVLNLSLHEQGVNVTDQARYCTGYRPHKGGLYLDILDVAEETVVKLPALRTLRILHPKLPSLQVASNDAVSKRQVVLPDYVRWDWVDEGFTDPDISEESDTDLFDDSSSEAS